MKQPTLLLTLLLTATATIFSDCAHAFTPIPLPPSSSLLCASIEDRLSSKSHDLDEAFSACQDELAKTCKVTIGVSQATGRLGLVATKPIKKGEVFLAMPYEDRSMLTAEIARKVVFKNMLPEKFEGWTGDTGLIALLILNEVARAASKGVDLPRRSPTLDSFMKTWVISLPSPDEMKELHPLMWPEEDQEVLQSSSTNKIYRVLDDIDEDAAWLSEKLFQNRDIFPETVLWNGETVPCFSNDGFKWAMALAQSRSVFVDGALRLLPVIDMCNHSDEGEEVTGGYMGTFGTTQGAQIVASQNYKAGEEVLCSYGPKSAADYLLEHGFCPPQCWKTAVSELTFEVDPEDRFYDDKLDILEFETYDQAPMDPVQSFDVVSAPGRDGEPDPAMIQFVRLCKLGATDAFLLESIFRKEVWGFMSMPVSEGNELNVVNAISEACQQALDELEQCPDGGPEICKQLRESESRALTRTLEYLQREKEALDLKEYYQERRLKDLGLDSEWTPEDDMSPDLGYGQTRVPGGADYDW
jgi:[ribulose-bisphosphate carboxylase]-lysine N-methyltransferase